MITGWFVGVTERPGNGEERIVIGLSVGLVARVEDLDCRGLGSVDRFCGILKRAIKMLYGCMFGR